MYKKHKNILRKCTSWSLRKKYELRQFFTSADHMSCPVLPPHKRSSTSNSTPSIGSVQDKKQYEKQTTKHRIGHAFRNSRGRRESEHKATKKCDSSVMTLVLFNASIFGYLTLLDAFSLHRKARKITSATNSYLKIFNARKLRKKNYTP